MYRDPLCRVLVSQGVFQGWGMRSPESEPVVRVAALFVDWRTQPLATMQKALNSRLEDEEARVENAPSIYSRGKPSYLVTCNCRRSVPWDCLVVLNWNA